MKEFCVKHPIVTFLIVETVVYGIVNVVNLVLSSGRRDVKEVQNDICDGGN